jgi:threonine aldolase
LSGDDPTVLALERRVADLFGKEAGLFVPSGTMGNLCSVLAHTWERGAEYIVGDRAHIYVYEQGGAAQFGGAHPRVLPTRDDGTLALDVVRNSVRAHDQHFPRTQLLCLENTHNMCGGRVVPTSYMRDAKALCTDAGIPLHLDGARIWNAAAALGEPLSSVGAPADSLSVCLSKALGAPAGSVVVGGGAFVAKARRLRKGLGGGMRQAGLLAAAGLYALDAHLPHLAHDHARAAQFAEALSQRGSVFAVEPAETNLVFFSIVDPAVAGLDADGLVACLAADGVKVLKISGQRMRAAFHHQVDDEGLARALASVARILADPAKAVAAARAACQGAQTY